MPAIVVALKQVPDPTMRAARCTIEGTRVTLPAGQTLVMNGFCENALELALRLRESLGGTVTAVAVGPSTADDMLRRALAMGADAIARIDDAGASELDAHVVASALAALIREQACDLVLGGRVSSDTGHGQVPATLAELLDVPFVAPVSEVAVAEGHARVRRLLEDGSQVLDVTLPAVLGISNEGNAPRQPTVRAVLAARRAPITVRSLASLGLEGIAPRRSTVALARDERERRAELISAASAAEAGVLLADRLRAAKVL